MEHSTESLKQKYGDDIHPRFLEIALMMLTERLNSSNSRCVKLMEAIKYFVNDFNVPKNRVMKVELNDHLERHINFL